MDKMIRNNTATPFYFPFTTKNPANGNKGEMGRIYLEPNTITGVEESLFDHVLAKSGFFIERQAKGEIEVMEMGAKAESAANASRASHEAIYGSYRELLAHLAKEGGAKNPELAPYLDADGMPKLDLLRSNMGPNIEPQVMEQFKQRYLIEKANGLHGQPIKLPGGKLASNSKLATVSDANNEPPKVAVSEAELIKLGAEQGIEALRKVADSLGVKYAASTTVELLIKKILKTEND